MRTDMHFLGAALIRLGGLPSWVPYNESSIAAVFAARISIHRDRLHAGNEVSVPLVLGHEGSGPGMV